MKRTAGTEYLLRELAHATQERKALRKKARATAKSRDMWKERARAAEWGLRQRGR